MANKAKIILIDDEPLARTLLEEMLETDGRLEIVAACGDGFEGLKAIQQHQPDLVFLDIQMPKITGFEMLELLESPPKVVFTTAYDEYALKAFEVSALDYLLKPITPERVKKAVSKFFNAEIPNYPTGGQSTAAKMPEQLRRIVVKEGQEIKIIPLEDVLYIEAADDYAKVTTIDKYYLKHQRMSAFEAQLPSWQFVRTHRSYIVNTQQILKVELYEKEQYCAVLQNGRKLPVSRSGYARLKQVLGI